MLFGEATESFSVEVYLNTSICRKGALGSPFLWKIARAFISQRDYPSVIIAINGVMGLEIET